MSIMQDFPQPPKPLIMIREPWASIGLFVTGFIIGTGLVRALLHSPWWLLLAAAGLAANIAVTRFKTRTRVWDFWQRCM